MDFEKAFTLIVHLEGGLVDNPLDPGGKTRYGISQQAFPTLDIENLTLDDAKAIYRREFWERCRCSTLPDPVSLFVFDAAVHMGPKPAAILLQQILGVAQDGIIGPQTLNAASRFDTMALGARFLAERALALMRQPTFTHFGKGWSNRLFTLALAV
jgi:lysozyme family protein